MSIDEIVNSFRDSEGEELTIRDADGREFRAHVESVDCSEPSSDDKPGADLDVELEPVGDCDGLPGLPVVIDGQSGHRPFVFYYDFDYDGDQEDAEAETLVDVDCVIP